MIAVRGTTKSRNSRTALMIVTFGSPGMFGVRTRVYRDESIEGVWVESRVSFDVVQPDQNAGVWLNGIVA